MLRYKRPDPPPKDPYQHEPPPVDRPVAVYYRQSTEGQVGNVSTTLQTVNMVEHLERIGWMREQVLMIDMDAGFSGQLKIRERPGMSHLFDLIENGHVGAVASQEVDRFFRDITQIQTNIFIDACKRNDVKVLTPTMLYDFAHPLHGRYHIQIFRERAQASADHLQNHILGRLVAARLWREERGIWAGRTTVPGYMVDMRETLPNGSTNPNWRRYMRFDAYADVMLAYFEAFRANEGNLRQTQQQLEKNGPFFPEYDPAMLPKGFTARPKLDHRSDYTGRLVPSESGLSSMFTNVTYIGHWTFHRAVVLWNHHEPIIPLDLFMYAFNKLSSTDFLGDPNPDYSPYRTWTRHNKADRPEAPPTYSGLVFSDDLSGRPHSRLSGSWGSSKEKYNYVLYDKDRKYWGIRSYIVDAAIDRMLLERLKATTIDEDAWQQALDSMQYGERVETRRIESSIREAKRAQDNLVSSLTTLNNSEMIQRAEARYEALGHEIAMLSAELAHHDADQRHKFALTQARPALEKLIERWEDVPRQERRSLFEAFAHYINIHRVNRNYKKLTVYWRDGSTTDHLTKPPRTYYWEPEDLEKLRQMVENNVPQVEILKTFPAQTWRLLQMRYSYHFTENNRWPKTYTGRVDYPIKTSWADTVEAQAEAEKAQPVASHSQITRRRSGPGRWSAAGRWSAPLRRR
jgi:DNA invertase Pin-like site-specific DNA recombinase